MIECKQVEERSIAYVEGNLTEEQQEEVTQHALTCETCANLLEQTQEIAKGFDRMPLLQTSERMSQNFAAMLQEEKQLLETQNTVKVIPLNWKSAFMAAASVAILLMGYVVGSHFSGGSENQQIVALQKESDRLKEEMTLAMLENRSASKRIQAVNFSEEIQEPDSKVLMAIIERLQLDENINVRLSAAEALSRFSENDLVKDAFIEALSVEKNPEVQIAVMQFLVTVKDKRALVPMQTLLEQPEVPLFVKNKVDESLKQLM